MHSAGSSIVKYKAKNRGVTSMTYVVTTENQHGGTNLFNLNKIHGPMLFKYDSKSV